MRDNLPWLYPYVAESAPRRGREVLRPVVAASIPGSQGSMEPYLGLVDTGAESVLAASWLADLAGLDLSSNSDKAVVGIGGQVVEVVFAEVELRLHRVDAAADFISWRTDVGFVRNWEPPFALVLGQSGFLDQFTVTFHRGAGALAVEDWAAFDARFGTGSPKS